MNGSRTVSAIQKMWIFFLVPFHFSLLVLTSSDSQRARARARARQEAGRAGRRRQGRCEGFARLSRRVVRRAVVVVVVDCEGRARARRESQLGIVVLDDVGEKKSHTLFPRMVGYARGRTAVCAYRGRFTVCKSFYLLSPCFLSTLPICVPATLMETASNNALRAFSE